jgi:hypothetical protein
VFTCITGAKSVTGALGIISRLNIGALELGDYLGQFFNLDYKFFH